MAEYLRPDVYVEEVPSGEKPIQAVSTSTGAFIGVTPRGVESTPILITSWTDYTNKFALGLQSPFLSGNHYLSNAIYGFFQNGGSRCYVVRVVSSNATSSKVELTTGGLEVVAKDSGAWSNNTLSVEVTSGIGNTYNLKVFMRNELVETLEGLSNSESDMDYFVKVINETSNYITVDETTDKSLLATSGKVSLVGGDDAFASLTTSDYIGTVGLKALDLVSDVNLVAIPGVVEASNDLLAYCDTRQDCFAILETPKGSTVESARQHRATLSGTNGALYRPWGKIVDPLGRNSNALKLCPPSGHIMGIYARIDSNRGVYKTPAGEECVVRGFVDLESPTSFGEIEILNPLGINCIISKPNVGVVIWGGRSLHPSKRYISDVRYDLMVKNSLQLGVQWSVFEPNNHELWERVDTSLRSFLDLQWRNGALRGTTPEQAYYVKCDDELNTESTINNGTLVAEIGYAKQKPSEFVIIKIVQKQNS